MPKRYECVSDGRRLDVQLAEATPLSRSRIAALLAEGACTVAGKPARKAGLKPTAGADIVLTVPDPRPAQPQPEDLPLEILYQDEDLAVVLKPAGMVVHPAAGNEDGTLVNALLHHLDHLSGIGGELRPGIVHRLDKDTSGLLIVAKNDEAQQALSEQLQRRTMDKRYLALVEGIPGESCGRMEAPIARSKKDRNKMAVDPEGREAITEWRTLSTGRGCALLEVHILTGRTHQIRVHMRAMGHPVAGDPIYGLSHGLRVERLMLHAYTLAFTHPTSGERLSFTAPIPAPYLRSLQKNGVALPPGWEVCTPYAG